MNTLQEDNQPLSVQIAALATSCRLTPRECDIVTYLVQGANNAEISHILEISRNTVKTHIRHVYEKVGVSSRAELLERIARI